MWLTQENDGAGTSLLQPSDALGLPRQRSVHWRYECPGSGHITEHSSGKLAALGQGNGSAAPRPRAFPPPRPVSELQAATAGAVRVPQLPAAPLQPCRGTHRQAGAAR